MAALRPPPRLPCCEKALSKSTEDELVREPACSFSDASRTCSWESRQSTVAPSINIVQSMVGGIILREGDRQPRHMLSYHDMALCNVPCTTPQKRIIQIAAPGCLKRVKMKINDHKNTGYHKPDHLKKWEVHTKGETDMRNTTLHARNIYSKMFSPGHPFGSSHEKRGRT